jgi:hypothetical protein
MTHHDQACMKSYKTLIPSSLSPNVSINIAVCRNWTAPAPFACESCNSQAHRHEMTIACISSLRQRALNNSSVKIHRSLFDLLSADGEFTRARRRPPHCIYLMWKASQLR